MADGEHVVLLGGADSQSNGEGPVQRGQRSSLRPQTQVIDEEQMPMSPSSSISSPTNKLKQAPKPFPWRAVSVILALNTVQPLAFELIFPFVNQMVLENGIATDPERVGFYSGIIESVFAIMSFISIMPCAYMSDHLGRKPVVLAGMTGLAVSIGLFGIAKSYWVMIATRCIGGMLGGTFATLKIMLVETVDKSHQGLAFSGLLIAYRMGQIVGQPMGGLLAHPEKNFSLFDTPFWHEYPFALPCFVASAYAGLAVTFTYFMVKESSSVTKRRKARSTYGATTPSVCDEVASVSPPERIRPSIRSVLTPQVVSAFLNSSLLALNSEAIFAIYPLFAFTPITSGGLGLSEMQIGAQLGFRSFNNVLVVLFYAPLERRFGVLRTYQFTMTFWPMTMAFFPFLNVLARQGLVGTWSFNAIVGLFFTVWSLACLSFSGSTIIINDSAPSVEALSVINGIGQMAATLPMALAPAFVTSLFAFSLKHEEILRGNLTWAVLLAIGVVGTVHSLTIKEATHDWREDSKDREQREQES
ncbi:hypothetical protein M0805_000119 [Coniferiporia weirii]|nr:hypothetical protein M0805_000119 [Coniferiporia weirii]